MATKKNTAIGQSAPAPASAPATGSITLPEMPPAETFVGLVAYGVDTTANESRHIPLEFLGRGVQACIDATNASITQTEAAGTATEEAVAAKQGADDAAEAARNEASSLSALKEAVADATADSIKKTKAAETATGAANTATTNANEATADAIEKTNAAQTATDEANAAKDAAIEATENLTADVSALVLTDANKPRIRELSGIDYSIEGEQLTGEHWIDFDGVRRPVRTTTYRVSLPSGYTPSSVTGIIDGISSVGFGANAMISVISVEGCRIDNDFFVNDDAVANPVNNVVTAKAKGRGWGRFVAFYGEAYNKPCTFIIKLTYTRS